MTHPDLMARLAVPHSRALHTANGKSRIPCSPRIIRCIMHFTGGTQPIMRPPTHQLALAAVLNPPQLRPVRVYSASLNIVHLQQKPCPARGMRVTACTSHRGAV
jgi:hypothetical protein